jgi:hypothetical protein
MSPESEESFNRLIANIKRIVLKKTNWDQQICANVLNAVSIYEQTGHARALVYWASNALIAAIQAFPLPDRLPCKEEIEDVDDLRGSLTGVINIINESFQGGAANAELLG